MKIPTIIVWIDTARREMGTAIITQNGSACVIEGKRIPMRTTTKRIRFCTNKPLICFTIPLGYVN